MLAAKARQESITKVRAWLGITDTEHKTPEADEENPLDMTDMTKSLYVTTQADDAKSPEITEIPKTTEGDNTLKRLILRIKDRDGSTTTSVYAINGHIVTQRTPRMQLVDSSVDIFQ